MSGPSTHSYPDFLECPLCFDVFTKVIETSCCHRCYCTPCLNDWLSRSQTCPGCRTAMESIKLCVPNIPFQRLVDELPTPCPNEPKGCKDRITRGIVSEHAKVCDYNSALCEYGGESCGGLIKKQLKEHNQTCLYRPVNCELCGAQLSLDRVKKHVEDVCPEVVVPCSNLHCQEPNITRSALASHLSERCQFGEIECPYASMGCQQKVLRGKLEGHIQSEALYHHEIVQIRLIDKENEISAFKTKLSALEKENGVLKEGLQNLSGLKPKLPHSPLYSFPVILPSCLVDMSAKKVAVLSEDFCVVRIKSDFSLWTLEKPETNAVLRSDIPVSSLISNYSQAPYYFEISLLKGTTEGISIGFMDNNQKAGLKGVLGTLPGTYGLNLQSWIASGGRISKPYPKPSGGSQNFGCGWDASSGYIFFTLDGVWSGSVWTGVQGPLYPALSFSNSSSEVLVNFGASKFTWNSSFWKDIYPIEKDIIQCLKDHKCTYTITKTDYFPQMMYGCKTCRLVDNMGICTSCAYHCHNGHDLVPPTASPAFYCDCGAGLSETRGTKCITVLKKPNNM